MISELIKFYALQEATEASVENITHLMRQSFCADCKFCKELCKCETIEDFYVKLGDSGILYIGLEVHGELSSEKIKSFSLYGFVAHTYVGAGDWYFKDYLYIMSDLNKIFDIKMPTNVFPDKHTLFPSGKVFVTHIPTIFEKQFHIDSERVS